MWRTVIVNNGEKLTTENGWLVVSSGEETSKVPIEDIYALIIDNCSASISIATINAITEAGAHICFCDEKHIPSSMALPMTEHYRPLAVVRRQLEMPQEMKDEFWKRIISAKISNQAACLRLCGVKSEKYKPLQQLAEEVLPGDPKNREAMAAKMYFKSLFGLGFRRFDDEVTNHALNYGYAVIRSGVAKTLTAYGYYCVIGLHHENTSNHYNLADDMMEPLRPVVDMVTDRMCDELFETLTKSNRRRLASIVNLPVKMNGKKTRLRYAIDKYISSFTTAILENDPDRLIVPEIVMIDEFFEDEQDGE